MHHTDFSCSSCQRTQPEDAAFCPFCGGSMERVPLVNPRAIVAFTPTMELGVFEAQLRTQRRRKLFGASLLGLVTAVTVAGGLVAGAWLSDLPAPRTTVAEAPAVAPAATPKADARVVLAVREVEGGFDIVGGDEVMHSIRTATSSRYDSMSARKRAVTVRLAHIAEKSDGRFEARPAGAHYEVVWTDGAASFRMFDVTPADAEALGSDLVDVAANLAADRMNAATNRPASPVSAIHSSLSQAPT